jgi:hypothetical protein
MRKAKWFYSFGKSYQFNILPQFTKRELLWKSKFGTPRCEYEPKICIKWLWWEFTGIQGSERYWEQWLWVHKYNDGDYEKAKSTWPWVDMETKLSSWREF